MASGLEMSGSMTEIEKLREAVSILEAQRAALGDALVDTALAPLREKLAALQDPLARPEQQRRLITVLFADIERSTRLGVGLEPDEILELMDGALLRLARPVEEHGGRVARFMGDGLLAVFGLPTSREDDALRAVRAGLDMLNVARDYARELEAIHEIRGFGVRVGISTGLVATGGGTEAEDTVMGLPVNLGARLESAAPPGGVLISHSTYRQVRNAFEVEPQDPIPAKGFPEPVPAYLVRSAKPRTFRTVIRTVQGVETPMVGRDRELRQLERAFERTVRHRQTHLVTVIGDAGIGKSRLLYEFDRWRAAQPSPAVPLKALPSRQTMGTPFSLMRELLAYRFGIQIRDSAAAARQKLEAGLAAFFADEPQMKAHFVGALLGYDLADSPHLSGVKDDARQLRHRALFYLAQYFAAATEASPTVIMVDDIHWADRPSLEALSQLVRERPNLRLLVVCLARPVLFEDNPDWARQSTLGDAGSIEIHLDPLPAEASYQLVQEMLHNVDGLPPSLLEKIVATAEGNAFYTEELIEMLADDGVIRRDATNGTWHLDPSRLDRLRVPTTLMAVLQARLDRLPLAERIVVQQASVVGRTFWGAALQALQGMQEPPERELAALSQREVISRSVKSTFAGTDEFQFKHALLCDAAYDTVLVRTRRAYHGLVAGWLAGATKASGRSNEYADIIAEHYEQADELEEAAAWYLQAGERAKAQGAPSEARDMLDRALRLLPETDRERRWRAMLARSQVLFTLGETETRIAEDEALVALAQELGDDARLSQAYQCQGYCLGLVGRYQDELAAYEKALAAARRAGNRHVEAEVLGQKVICLTRLGLEDRARRVAGEALDCAREVGDENLLVRNLTNVSLFYSEFGDLGSGVQLLEQQVAMNRRLANRQGEAVGLTNLGYRYVQLGMSGRAVDELERGVQLAEEIGHRQHSAYGRLNLALAHLRNGHLDRALRALEGAIPELEALQDRFGQAAGQTYLALVKEASGEHRDALERFARARTAFVQIGVPGCAHDAAAGLVRCLLALGQMEDARQQAEALWEHLTENGPGGMEFPVLAYLTCADLFAAVGETERSRTAVEKGYRELLERADRIGDETWRITFLENVPEHREITKSWKGG
jgi:class 3 adenylate cyclase/tetratricopeptide (TPR) repeat protein